MPKGVSKTYTSERRSLAMKKVWKRKSYRKKVIKALSSALRTQKHRRIQSQAQKRRWSSKAKRRQQSKALSSAWKKDKEGWTAGIRKGSTAAVNQKKSRSRLHILEDDDTAQKAVSKMLAKTKMTVPEKQMRAILRFMELPYEFVGNGRLMIGRYCPDFVRVDAKAVIEVYGYYHESAKAIARDKKRNIEIRKKGYKILVVWAAELSDLDKLARKIQRFDDTVLSRLLQSSNTRTPSTRKVKV